MSIGRWIRTAVHLRPSQVAWRVLHSARVAYRQHCPAREPPRQEVGCEVRQLCPPGDGADDALRRAALWRSGSVEYLGIVDSREEWRGAHHPKLWRYERQYHAEIVDLAVMHRREPSGGWLEEALGLVTSWERASPFPRGDAWEPYPVARRLLNWSLACSLAPELAPHLCPLVAPALRFLSTNLEHHLKGNHLLCDAAALVCGATLLGPAAERTWRRGVRLLAGELERQVLPDGGYAERTSQYHSIVLRDALLADGLSRLAGCALPPRCRAAIRKLAGWLAVVVRADGTLPWLNDAAPGATPTPAEVLSLAQALGYVEGRWQSWLGHAFGAGFPQHSLQDKALVDIEVPDTGWYFVREAAHELLFDHGPIGPDEQPGHGHSDALGFELYWSGKAIVVDTGVTTYDVGPVRDFERSARAHATVTVGGAGPDELWAAFRVGVRGKVSGRLVERTQQGLRILEGETRAPAGWVHRRRLAYWPGRALVVLDRVIGGRAPVASNLPLAPEVTLDERGLTMEGLTLALVTLSGHLTRRDASTWVGEGFGRRRPRTTLTFEADAVGRVAYAIVSPGSTVSLDGDACAIRSHSGEATFATAGLT